MSMDEKRNLDKVFGALALCGIPWEDTGKRYEWVKVRRYWVVRGYYEQAGLKWTTAIYPAVVDDFGTLVRV
jgi:hypothetical protein